MNNLKTKVNGKCYLCQKKTLVVIRDKLRHNIRRRVLRCANCSLVYLEPQSGTTGFYRSHYRKKHGPIMGKTLSSRELFEYNLPLQAPRIEQLAKWLKLQAKVLDIGSSTGHFLYAIKDRVGEVVGVELNLANADFTRRELGIKVFSEPLEELDLPPDYFDLITIYHTFEHVADPLGFLGAVRHCLKPGGKVCIEVPNLDDALLSLYQLKKFADFWFIEPHLFYYTPNTLGQMLRRAKFSGEYKTTQAFSLFNHLNWLVNGQPQGDWKAASTTPQLPLRGTRAKLRRQLNSWLGKVDQDYRRLLEKNRLGSMLTFIGTKK